jgi:X-X-X-Leu-X-X-Gly heptad repeat protein
MAKLTLKTVFSAVDRMSGPVKTITDKMEKFNAATGKLAKMGAAAAKAAAYVAAAAVAAGAAIGRATVAFAERGDDIARNASILGLSASAYQELAYAANLADVEMEAMTSATKKLNNNLGQLKSGTGALYTELKRTNPQLARQLRAASSTDEAFTLMADAIAKETNIQKRATLAQAAFGKTGQDLIPMMQGLAAARKEARDSGTIISDADVSTASRLDDALKRLKATGMSLANSSLAIVAEKLAPIAERMTAWAQANREIIGQKIDAAISAITKTLEALWFLLDSGIVPALLAAGLAMKVFAGAEAVLAVAKMAKSMGGLSAAFTALGLSPGMLAIGAIAALIMLIVSNWDKITGFFDKMANSAPSPIGAADGPETDAWGVPLAPASASSSSSSTLDVNFNNAPAGTTMRQTGKAPGISINQGATMRGGAR